MADSKVTALTALTAVAGNDVVPIVDDPGGSPVSSKIKVQDLVTGGYTTTATAAGTTTLTADSTNYQFFTGSTTQTIVLPDATTLSNGREFNIHNNSSGQLTIDANGGTDLYYVPGNSDVMLKLTSNGTSAGTWDINPMQQTFFNNSTAAQGAGFATDTYLTGSYVRFPFAPRVGTTYRMLFDVTKTAAGTATPIIQIRLGTAGSTADTSRVTFTYGAGTAAADTAAVEVIATFRTVGAGTAAVLQGTCRATTNLTTTGWSNAVKTRVTTSSGFDSTTASLGIGVSYNGGTSASHTVQLVRAELMM